VRRWVENAETTKISADKFEELKERFEASQDGVLRTIEVRSRDRLKALENTFDIRREKEGADMTSVLDDLEKTLTTEIEKDDKPEQLDLGFTEEMRLQLRRDRHALEARLARIPKERVQELTSIESRYADRMDHTFPVAIILLCPASMTEGGV
jgi:hypothetical protein